MNDEPLFKDNDLRLIESLVYDPSLKSGYELVRGCLVWADERPRGLSSEAEKCLSDLFSARALLHRGLKLSDDPFNPEWFQSVWERAQKQNLKWPGFYRLTLSEADKQYYHEQMYDDVF